MDRNTVVGFILIFALVIVYSIYNQRKTESFNEEQKHVQDSIALVDSIAALSAIPDLDSADNQTINHAPVNNDPVIADDDNDSSLIDTSAMGSFASLMLGDTETYLFENDLMKLNFSNKGATISSIELKDYKTFNQEPLILFNPGENKLGLAFYDNKRHYVHTDSLYFTPKNIVSKVSGIDTVELVFRAAVSDDQYIEYAYRISGSSSMIDFSISFHNMETVLSDKQPSITLNWATKLNVLERDLKAEQKHSTIYYGMPDNDVDYLSESKEYSGQDAKQIKYDLRWVSYKQKFFNTTLISDNAFKSGRVEMTAPDSGSIAKDLRSTLYLPFSKKANISYPMHLYVGPNEYYTLKKLDIGLDKLVPMGSSILGFINKRFILPVFTFFEKFTGNYGLIILLLSIFIKLILTPLTFKSYKSQAKMKVIKPEVDALKEKYQGDTKKFQMEQMKLYRKAGVNVLGGCLPMLLQFPILISMYRFFPGAFNLRQEGFLWVTDFTTYDSVYHFATALPFYGDHISLFTILMTISSILYARMNSQLTGATGQMKMFQYFFPIMLLFIFNSFSAALTYYYFLYNILTFAQTWFIQRFVIDEATIRAQMEKNKTKPKKVGRLAKIQKRMEEVQRQQNNSRKKK